MLSEALAGNMQFDTNADNWEQAIKKSASILVEKNYISDSYVDRMIESVHKNGAYIVVVPGVAMPHTQSKGDVKKTCISYTKFNKPVEFPGGLEASIFFCLAAEDCEGHLDLISELALALMDEQIIHQLSNAKSELEVKTILG